MNPLQHLRTASGAGLLASALLLAGGPGAFAWDGGEARVRPDLPAVMVRPAPGPATLSFIDDDGRPLDVVALVGEPIDGAGTDGRTVALPKGKRPQVLGVRLAGAPVPLAVTVADGPRRGGASAIRIAVPRQWLGAPPPLAAPPAGGFNEAVRQWVMDNPDVLRAALDPSRQMAARAEEMRDEVLASAAAVLHEGQEGVFVVGWGDYRCGYTRRAHPALEAAAAAGATVRIQELAVLGPESEALARRALAAEAMGVFPAAHRALIAGDGPEMSDAEFAAAVGADPERFAALLSSGEVARAYDASRSLAQRIGISGTPAFVVYGPGGVRLSPGYLEPERMVELIDSVR